jgi:hypothetical protein
MNARTSFYNILAVALAVAFLWYVNPSQLSLMIGAILGTLFIFAHLIYKNADKLKALRQQREESAEKIQSRRRMYMEWHQAFNAGAIMMSVLTILMTMIGAFGLYSWVWAALAFCLGSIGAVILRHYSTPAFVGTVGEVFTTPTLGSAFMLLLLFVVFFGNTVFLAVTSIKPMLDDEGQRRNERILNADELERQQQKVDAAWSQVELYDQYKDPAGIAAEQNANANTQRQASDAIAKLNASIDRINAGIAAIVADNALYMTHNYDGKTDTCTPRNDRSGAPYTTRATAACAKIAPLRSQHRNVLGQVSSASTATSTSYESGHHTYNSKYATWQQESDKLSNMKNGEGVVGADRAFERALSQLFKTTPEEALWLFIMLVGLFFDAMTIFALLAKQHFRERCTEEFERLETKRRLKKQFSRLVDAGLDEATAAAVIGGNQAIPPAKVSRPHMGEEVPAMFSGGHIHSDGLIHAHEGEAVLNPGATAWMQQQYPGFIDDLNAAFLNRNTRFQIETPFPNRNSGNTGNATARGFAGDDSQAGNGVSEGVSETVNPGNGGKGRKKSRGSHDEECCKAEIRKILMLDPDTSGNVIMAKLREEDEHGNKKYRGGTEYFSRLINEVKKEIE